MANKDETHEEKIRRLADEGKIEFAESDEIDEYYDIAREFIESIFGISIDECMISDESALSDFATCCIPDEYEPDKNLSREEGWAEMQNLGSVNMVRAIYSRYQIAVQSDDYLITVFEQIRKSREPVLN